MDAQDLPAPASGELTCSIVDVVMGRVLLRSQAGDEICCQMNGVQSNAFRVAQGCHQQARVRLEILGRDGSVWQAELNSVAFVTPQQRSPSWQAVCERQ